LAGNLEFGRGSQARAATQPADPLREIAPRGRFDVTLSASGRLGAEPSYQLSIVPRGVSFHPAELPAAVENVAGAIRVTDGQVAVDGLAARYGRDELKLPKLRVSLKELPRSLRVEPIEAVMDFDSPRPAYPLGVARILDRIGPIGSYKLAGYVQVNLLPAKPGEPVLDYDLALTTEHGALMPAFAQLPLLAPKLEIHFTPAAIDVSTLEVPAFGGTVTATGHVSLANDPGEKSGYKGRLRVAAVNLRELAGACAAKGQKPIGLTGTAWADVRLSGLLADGSNPPLDSLRAVGDVTIHNGHFFELPLFKSILEQLDLGEVVVVGDAAVVSFNIADRVVNITKGLVSAPVLAIEGNGTVGFDGALALKVIAADTSAKPYQDVAGSDVAGRIIGAIDNTLNAAGRHGLYEVRAGGTIQNPQVKAIPIPGLTTAGRDLIDRVRRGSRGVPAEGRDAEQARHVQVPTTQKSGSP
jgi:hypothetical protein